MTRVRWRDLTPEFRDRMRVVGLLNGCGPDGRVPRWVLRAMRSVLPGYFTEWCDQHDFNYILGKTEADRIKADWQFYEALDKAARRAPWYSRSWHRMLARVAYGAVRSWGRGSFYYGFRERTLEDVTALLEGRERSSD